MSLNNPKLWSAVSRVINLLTTANAASATGTKLASTLIPCTASNTSLTVTTSLPVNALTTASNSGNASMMIAISLANEIPSYAPSLISTLENEASTIFPTVSTNLP